MKIKIKDSIVIAGYPGVGLGDVIEVPDPVARGLINVGYAVEFYSPPEIVESRSPEVENRDIQPSPKRAKKTLP